MQLMWISEAINNEKLFTSLNTRRKECVRATAKETSNVLSQQSATRAMQSALATV